MDEVELHRLLSRVNVWWDGDEVPTSLKKADHLRRDFYIFRKQVYGDRQINAILGPRQVGKTTLCGQLIDWLLSDKGFEDPFGVPLTLEPTVDPERILYLTLDNIQMLSNPDNVIRDSIEVLERLVLERSLGNVDETIYIVIDEVQKTDDWAETLKYYTDTYDNLQFVIAGSVSTIIQQDASETLVGRIDRQVLMPMKFVDVIRYHEVLDDEEITNTSLELRKNLNASVKEGDFSNISGKLAKIKGQYTRYEPELLATLNDYLLKGGYPGVLADEPQEAFSKLDTDLQYTVTGDLADTFGVRKPRDVLRVLNLIAESTGGKLNVQNIAESADVNRDTVDRYLEYLEEFFLVSPCRRYRSSEYQSGGRPKMYLQDVGLFNTISGTLSEETLQDSQFMGKIVETATLDHCRRLQFNFSGGQDADIWYWDKYQEVDCIIEGPGYTLPIEVKHGDSTNYELRGLRRFIEESDAGFGIAVNNGGALEQDGEVLHVPLWMFLYMC